MKQVASKSWKKVIDALRRAQVIVMHHPKALFLAGIMIGSFFGYTISVFMTEASYRLSNGSVQLIGDINPALADKLELDKNMGAYRFNAESISPEMSGETDPSKVAALLSSQKQQTGGGGKESQNLYSLDLPIDPSKGMKVYDSNSKTSFKLTPEFEMGAGRSESGRVVYPLDEGGQAVYTVKANGIKEDIVLQKPRGDALSFKYTLELPKTLEARLDDRGNLGIYSVDPAVSSAIAGALQNGASSTDTERLKDVQENGTKDFLTYLIPAPTIMQSGNRPNGHTAKAAYHLNGDKLTVETTGLEKLVYPISIDPSVVVTSTSDFATGNDEGNISFDTDAISRAQPTAGSVGAWGATSSFTGIRSASSSVAYNGYLYVVAGTDTGGGQRGDVQYAPINAADGTVGAWVATSSLVLGRTDHSVVAYSGYLYVVAGGASNGSIEYAPINADGTVGAWTIVYVGIADRYGQTVLVSNGYLYMLGGDNGVGTKYNDVHYAPINADGTVGAWAATTSFATVRSGHGSVVYNGYMYVVGGVSTSNTRLADVQYAPINADGTVGAWTATTSLAAVRSGHGTYVHNGYLYVNGGVDSAGARLADVQYAPINADGTVGAWTATTSLAVALYGHASVAYKGYLYRLGGSSASGSLADVRYSKVDTLQDIKMSSWASTTSLGAGGGSPMAKVTTRSNHGSAVYNGYIYVIGGTGASTTIVNVHYAPLNANGTVGTWAVTASLTQARAGLSAIAVNGYLYAIGGQDASSVFTTTSYYAPINADGTIGTWATTTALTSARSDHGLENYNGYMYVTGGITTGAARITTVEYAAINANGTLGSWTTTTALPVARGAHGSALYNGFIYVFGGSDGTSTPSTVLYAAINANGTVGTWNSTTSMSEKRVYIDARIYNGYVFISGGYDGGSVEYNTVVYAKINADGTIGTWSSGPNFTTGRDSHGSEIYNGYIYITGGWNGSTPYGDVQYASLIDAGATNSPGMANTWSSTTNLATGVYGHSSVIYNDYIYVIGGYDGSTYLTGIRYAPINAGGAIGTWTTSTNSMTTARSNGAATVYGGYLYVSGGQTGTSTYSNTVEYTKINANGTLDPWQTSGNVFTTARFGHVAFAYSGRIYIVGGGNSSSVALGDVKYATINASNGTIGTWTDTTATTAARDTDGFMYGGRIYIAGGYNGTTYFSNVRYASINADGTLGAWTTAANNFITGRSRHAAAALNGYIYISGGANASQLGDLQYAAINTDGSIGAWRSSNSISTVSGGPATYSYHTLSAYNGRMYNIAGMSSTNSALATNYRTAFNGSALKANYSKLINIGQQVTLDSIITNGAFLADQTKVTFRVAGSNGIFGSWQSPAVLSGAPQANVQYVMYKVSLDDSLGSSLAATDGRSSATDITISYTLPSVVTPDNRLRQNKYFDASGVLQPLQTQ